MVKKPGKIAATIIIALMIASCSATRYVPQGKYVLINNKVEPDKSLNRKERITQSTVEPYIQQDATPKVLGTRVMTGIYNMADSTPHTKLGKAVKKIGTPPVLMDTLSAVISAKYIGKYVKSMGYFDGSASFSLDTAKGKGDIVYYINQGEGYRINNIEYEFKDSKLEKLIIGDTNRSLIKKGIIFNEKILNDERKRVKDFLQNRGYYAFSVDNMAYVADTTKGGHEVDIKVVVKQAVDGSLISGEPILKNSVYYGLNKIYIYPNHQQTTMDSPSSRTTPSDTLKYNGLNILTSGEELKLTKEVLRRVVCLKTGDMYNAREVIRAYTNLMNLGYYKSARITFVETDAIPDVEYAEGAEKPDKYLDCIIYCVPSKLQSFNIGLENTFTSDYYGVAATLGYHNRNLFHHAEALDITLTGSYDFYNSSSSQTEGSFETGVTVAITLPRFVMPVKINKLQKKLDLVANPRTKFEVSINNQRRPYYNRVLSGANWGYYWAGNRFTQFSMRPIDVSLVKVNSIDPDFFNALINPYLKASYQSQLIAGMSASWSYNNSQRRTHGTSIGARVNVETTGNMLQGFCMLTDRELFDNNDGDDTNGVETGQHYELFGVPFAQYFRTDLSFTNGIPIGGVTLVYRLYGGVAVAYGNANAMPYDRLFYAGGSNSMRGWVARTLGPGSTVITDELAEYPQQTGYMKLEFNLEGRFPIWSILKGAVFCDIGNVWNLGKEKFDQESVFQFNTFYKQLGANVGLGLRFDISMTVVRLDWGIRVHNPNLPEGQRWVGKFSFDNTALNVAVGYPF